MPWPIDKSKLERVQQLMVQYDLDALVVRAPDNIVYLTNYWCMKGYDAVVFPRQGEATLIALEPQLADAQRNSWTKDIRLFKGYDERDPRPPQYRALDLALVVLKERGLTDKVAIELNMGTQSADRISLIYGVCQKRQDYILAVSNGPRISVAHAEPLARTLESFVLMYENHAVPYPTRTDNKGLLGFVLQFPSRVQLPTELNLQSLRNDFSGTMSLQAFESVKGP